jgi:lipopolysaccharide/colanic/teichoic acid biosynthesis glycosyltransferase
MPPTPDRAAECPPGWPEIDRLDPATPVAVEPIGGWFAAGKTAGDYVLAVLLLVPGLPLIGLCWLGVKLTSAGPGFYRQTRLGRNGRPYRIIKLRTMSLDAEAGGATWAALKGDSRVTGFGRFLRATHLDELPQLFNVLAGHMSLVGPRPERPEMIHLKGLNSLVPGYRERLRVRPGVTGLAQVQLPADTDVRSVRHKVAYDLYYIGHASPWLDLRVMAATAFKACGMGPRLLRRVFRLPPRERVAEVFRANTLPPAPPAARPSSRLQPA